MGKKKKKIHFYFLFLVLFSIVVGVKMWSIQKTSHELEKQISSLDRQIESEQEKQVELLQEKEYCQSDEYIEKMAREKFGLVKPNEKVYIPVEEK